MYNLQKLSQSSICEVTHRGVAAGVDAPAWRGSRCNRQTAHSVLFFKLPPHLKRRLTLVQSSVKEATLHVGFS